MGEIIDYALKQKSVRGVTFQPTQLAGRTEMMAQNLKKLHFTEVRRKIVEQSNVFYQRRFNPSSV